MVEKMRIKWLVYICLVMVFLTGCTNQEQLTDREQQFVKLENEYEQLKLSLEYNKDKYEIQTEKLAAAVEEISELENEIQELNDLLSDGQPAVIGLLINENRMLYELIDVDRELMDDDYRLKSYMDLRFVEKGDKIGDFIIDEYHTDNEMFFRRFAISLTGSIVLEGSFVHVSNADYDDVVFQIDESNSNKLPYVIERQNIEYLHIDNYEEYLSQSDIDALVNGSVERIEKDIEIEKLFISGQLGSDIYYGCNVVDGN